MINGGEAGDLFRAISSLYADGLKPYGRIIRKRLAEGERASGRKPRDLGLKQLRSMCEVCRPWLYVQVEEGGDWSALLQGRPQTFVDVHSPRDVYPPALWDAAAEYFQTLKGKNCALPGGRYACARVLMDRNLPFLAGRSLGEISHIVQLAISEKKLLGYRNSTIVAYTCSQSKAKEMCAAKQKPFAALAHEGRPVATWGTVRSGLKQLLDNLEPDQEGFPLSNIKRLFRITYDVDLSETALGYAKLSELLQDARLKDLCSIRLQEQGYFVARRAIDATSNPSALSVCSNSAVAEPCKVGLPPNSALRERARGLQPLQLEEVSPVSSPMSLPLPAPVSVSCCSVGSWVRPNDVGEADCGSFEFFPATPQPWSPTCMWHQETPHDPEALHDLPRLLGSALNRGPHHGMGLGAAESACLGGSRTGDLAHTFLDLLKAPLTGQTSGLGCLPVCENLLVAESFTASSVHGSHARVLPQCEEFPSQGHVADHLQQAQHSGFVRDVQPRQPQLPQPPPLHRCGEAVGAEEENLKLEPGRSQRQQGPFASRPPLTPSKLDTLGLRVQNTFINTTAPPLLVSPTAAPGKACMSSRSSSLPRKWKM